MINNYIFGIRCIVLYIFLLYVENYPNMKIYSDETKFNMYRSLLCLYFVIYSFDIIINNFNNILDPINIQSDSINNLFEWFNAYLIIDLGKMIYLKNKRLDLYIHHILAIMVVSIGFYYNKIGLFNTIILLNETISIVTGIDSIYMEDNDLEKSNKCKIFRKNIIKYLRLPIWLFSLYILIFKNNDLPNILNGLYSVSIIMCILLDQYWLYKCNKVINKYE
jgi:hypothetical protein